MYIKIKMPCDKLSTEVYCDKKVECEVAILYGDLCLWTPPCDSWINTEKKICLEKF
jgi:hypothetical protein